MNQENAKEYQKQYQEFRKSLYKEYPDVERFEKKKMRMGMFLLCYCLVLYIVKAFVLNFSIYLIFKGLITGFGVSMIFILAAMGSKWRIACGLYFLTFWQLITYAQIFYTAKLTSWERFRFAYIDGFSQYPLQISLDYLTWLMTLLILGFAMWLTLVPANRRMADQSDVISQQLKAYMAAHGGL